jgi:hypothetical protein
VTDYNCSATTTLLDLAQHLYCHGAMLNERYLHHAFSHRLQVRADFLRLTDRPEAPHLQKGYGARLRSLPPHR